MPQDHSQDPSDDRLGAGLAAFKEIADEALGWSPKRDEFELLPVSSVLQKIEAFYEQDIKRFDVITERAEREERFIQEVSHRMEEFSSRVATMARVPKELRRILFCVPLELPIFQAKHCYSPLYRVFSDAHQQVAGPSCDDRVLLQCLSLRADMCPYSLRDAELNESLAFCGSLLSRVFDAEVSPSRGKIYFSFKKEIVDCVRSTRRRVFPRTKDSLATAFHSDVLQALLYAECLHGGFRGAKELFLRIVAPADDRIWIPSGGYAPDINYPQILQEFTQQFEGRRPSYEYVLTAGSRPHAPTFICWASYEDASGQGLGATKREARHRAAYVLMRQLTRGKGDVESPQE